MQGHPQTCLASWMVQVLLATWAGTHKDVGAHSTKPPCAAMHTACVRQQCMFAIWLLLKYAAWCMQAHAQHMPAAYIGTRSVRAL